MSADTPHRRADDPPVPGLFLAGDGFTPWQQRVVEEKGALDARLERLRSFFLADAINDLSPSDVDLLHQQEIAMSTYSAVLNQRIQSFR